MRRHSTYLSTAVKYMRASPVDLSPLPALEPREPDCPAAWIPDALFRGPTGRGRTSHTPWLFLNLGLSRRHSKEELVFAALVLFRDWVDLHVKPSTKLCGYSDVLARW